MGFESQKDYLPGKFHPVHLGDVLNERYHIFRKLGSGGQATVWLARDKSVQERRFVAVKVFSEKSSGNELRLKEVLGRLSPQPSHPGSKHVELALDSFVVHGPNGQHFCKVLEPLGPSLSGVLENAFDRRADLNEPEAWLGKVLEGDTWSAKVAKRACWQILLGLDYLHSQRIAHRDIQPANVCLALDYDLSSLSENEIQKAVWPTETKVEDPLPEPISPQGSGDSFDNWESSSDDSVGDLFWKHEREEREKFEAAQWQAFEADPGDALAEPHSAAWKKANFLNSRSCITGLIQGPNGTLPKPGELRYIVGSWPLENIHSGFDDAETPPRLVLVDLGFACAFDECEKHPLHNLSDYRPPEGMLGIPTTHKVDIFSAGLLFWEIVMLRRLVEGRCGSDDPERIYQKNRQLRDLALRLGPMPATLRDMWPDSDGFVDAAGNALDMKEDLEDNGEPWGPDDFEYGDIWHHAGRRKPLDMDEEEMRVFVHLLLQMMRWDPKERPSTSELLRHEWFKKFQ
ncbi:kinase-like domain-containing protein [Cercophora scortea]|uniref:non-specific serine/threonine protein kinase n=1 Tax=Cercophora scortea TaxID=314031 RepID=A0AAE0I3V0_9PEZI|nr:kinase-like domain-containing protein [Cercophora scortea]